MKECFLQIGDDEPDAYQVKVDGYHFLVDGVECDARHVRKWCRWGDGWRRVRIVKLVDHIGSTCNRSGAVYEAELLREYLPPEPTGRLFE